MRPSSVSSLCVLALFLLGLGHVAPLRADDSPAPEELIHIPAEEMDLLLSTDRKGIVLRYDEYARLLEGARARARLLSTQPPVDGALVAASGEIDATGEDVARMVVRYEARVLADGPRSVEFPLAGLALEALTFEQGEGLYEEWGMQPRLRFEGPGARRVRLDASALFARKGAQRLLGLRLPPASAMALALRLPPGHEGVIAGEGAPISFRTPANKSQVVNVRPARDGTLRLVLAPVAEAVGGPPVLDGQTHILHHLGDGIIASRAVLHADVYRQPASRLSLDVPVDVSVRALEGAGVTGFSRSEDRRTLWVDLEKPVLGRVSLTLDLEAPFSAQPSLVLPSVRLRDALRQEARVAVRFDPQVKPQAVRVEGGRRLPVDESGRRLGILAYLVSSEQGQVTVDLEPRVLTLESNSTYYLNLAEAGRTLIASINYRVVEGTLFTLRPSFPDEYELTELTLNGSTEGFTRERRPDGTVEITLARGVAAGAEILLAGTFERTGTDWVPEQGRVSVPLRVPSSGASREDGVVALGADAAFSVLETQRNDLVAVGAADLTARGINPAGLLYGYRLDGPAPSLGYEVERLRPLLEAQVVTSLHPEPRRLQVRSTIVHVIRRAGVRSLDLLVPAWVDPEQVRIEAEDLRSAAPVEGGVAPEGYRLWRAQLSDRRIGRHVLTASWYRDLDQEDWRVDPAPDLGANLRLEQVDRFVVARRAQGLEVQVLTEGAGVRPLEIIELPPEAATDALGILEVLRLADGGGVGLAVKKHGGAAVLSAIATLVDLRTAVAREGVLRTRANVHLFNVDRQFLEVALPSGSNLIGAVVDGQPVKPLSGHEGLTLVPVPVARDANARTVVALTYETKLGEELGAHLTVRGPQFPGLEVLETRHFVALDPDLAVTAVEGDYGTHEGKRLSPPQVWLFSDALWASGDERATSGDRIARGAVPGSSSGYAAGDRSATTTTANWNEGEDQGASQSEGELGLEASNYEPARELLDEAIAETRRQVRAEDGEDGARAPKPRSARPPSEPLAEGAPTPTSPAPVLGRPGGAGGGGAGVPLDPPMGPPSNDPASSPAEEPPSAGGEVLVPSGGTSFTPGRIERGGRRKGLLSLDVPVMQAPGGVRVRRLGSGGEIRLTLATRAAQQTRYHLLGLGVVALCLWLGRSRSLRGRGLVLAGAAALAGALSSILGDAAGVGVAALANGATLTGGLWLAAALARRVPLLIGRTAVALLLAVPLLVVAAAAHADEPRPKPPVVKEPSRLFVPYDPANPGELREEDRVFLPLDAWLALFKAAHPDQDPEQVMLGRMVVVRDARYDLSVEGEQVVGVMDLLLAKRGEGTLLVALPLAGMAVSQATLDGKSVRLLLDPKGVYRIALEATGEQRLSITFHVPILPAPEGRTFTFAGLPYAGAHLSLLVPGFSGSVHIEGRRGRMETRVEHLGLGSLASRTQAWLGSVGSVQVRLADPAPEALPDTVRTRAESRTVHSVRDSGTETQADLVLHVLQGKAPFVDLALGEGLRVLSAQGPQVARWEVLAQPTPRLRISFGVPVEGQVPVSVRVVRSADTPERVESLPELSVLDTTGEGGTVVVNADPALRLDLAATDGLFRMGRPIGAEYAGADGAGTVVGAWRFAARPAPLEAQTRRVERRMEQTSLVRVVLGDDHVRTRMEAEVRVDRATVGELVFAIPGEDEVREVQSEGLRDWWISGAGEERQLTLRYDSLRQGRLAVQVELRRRLAGVRENVAIPRWALLGAQRDQGRLILYSLPDVELRPGAVAGLISAPLIRAQLPSAIVEGAVAVQAYTRDVPLDASLLVGLGTPVIERRAVVVSLVSPGDDVHRIENLVLFDVRRGITDRLAVFVPDGGHAARDEVRTRDLREKREERVVRAGPDGKDVPGVLYDLRLQSPRGGVIEVIISQAWDPARPVQVVEPENSVQTRWFSLVRTFLDGQAMVRTLEPKPDLIEWVDIPFVPSGVDPNSVAHSYSGRKPFALEVKAERRRLEDQAEAIVLSAVADAVLGLDSQARVRLTYRVFNRARQFLRLRLPEGAVLFGATSAGQPVKPLAGAGGTMLLPIPKVPLGGTGYEVSVLYRARAGRPIDEDGRLTLPLPEVLDVQVDRTVARLYLPDGYEYDFESHMSQTDAADVAADLAEVAVQEARDLLQIAETGTLAQRVVACDNGLALLQQARALNESAPVQGKQGQLDAQIAAVEKQWKACRIQVADDVKEATRLSQSVAVSQEEFGGNAANFLTLDDAEGDGQSDSDALTGVAQGRAVWRYNSDPAAKGSGKAPDAEFQTLKKELASELGQQRDKDQRKNVAGRIARGKSPAQDASKGAEAGETPSDNMATGLAWLNERLSSEQDRNRQLGTNFTRNDREPSEPMAQGGVALPNLALGDQPQAGYLLVPQTETERALRNVLRVDSYRLQGGRLADGLIAGQQELAQNFDVGPDVVIFGSAMNPANVQFSAHGLTGEGTTQTGLMGVDVPLPRLGQVFYFRGERAGGEIRIEASEQGMSFAARLGLFLLLTLAALIGLLAWRRRRRPALA